jgi:hypothetical protein
VHPAGEGVEVEESDGDGRDEDDAIVVDGEELVKRRNCRKKRGRGLKLQKVLIADMVLVFG